MTKISQKLIFKAADFYINVIVSKLVFKLKRVPQEYRLRPDYNLSNVWEEICVQQQSEKWQGFNFIEMYLEAQISLLLDHQPEHVKLILSYSEGDTDPVYDESLVVDKILIELYSIADNYSSKNMRKYME